MSNTVITLRLHVVDGPCPHCKTIMLYHQTEECVECPECGYILCGDDAIENHVHPPDTTFNKPKTRQQNNSETHK